MTVLPKGKKNSLAFSGLIAVICCFCAGVAYVLLPHQLCSRSHCCLGIVDVFGKVLAAIGILFVIFVGYIKAAKAECSSPIRRMIVCGPPPFLLLMLAIGVAIVFAHLADNR